MTKSRRAGRIHFLAITVLAIGTLRCETNVQDAPVSFGVPEVTSTPYDLNHRQSETAIVAGALFSIPILLTTYNDGSLTIPSKTDYATNTYFRGWSTMGWSTSGDAGQTWDYRGQVSPSLAGSSTGGGGSCSALVADPSAAVDQNSKNLVYMAQLGVTKTSWDLAGGGSDTIVFGSAGVVINGGPFCGSGGGCLPPFTAFSPIDLADSLCVAQSTDGGLSFTALGCVTVGAAAQADRTALTVDGNGYIWAASIFEKGPHLASLGAFRVYRSAAPSDVSAFIPVPPPISNTFDPILKHDPEGNVWLGGMGSNDGSIWLQEYDIKKNAWVKFLNVAANCGRFVALDNQASFGGFTSLRNAHPYDFDIGLDEHTTVGGAGGGEVVRLAFEQTDPDNSLRHLIEVAQYDINLSSCVTSPVTGPSSSSTTWAEDGTQFMPSLSYANRGGDPYWSLVYLTTANVKDPNDQYIYPASNRVSRAGFANPRLSLFTSLAPPDWYACFDNSTHYWGDYFGVTQVRDVAGFWWGVSAFTSSRPAPPCTGGGISPQHVVASRW